MWIRPFLSKSFTIQDTPVFGLTILKMAFTISNGTHRVKFIKTLILLTVKDHFIRLPHNVNPPIIVEENTVRAH